MWSADSWDTWDMTGRLSRSLEPYRSCSVAPTQPGLSFVVVNGQIKRRRGRNCATGVSDCAFMVERPLVRLSVCRPASQVLLDLINASRYDKDSKLAMRVT